MSAPPPTADRILPSLVDIFAQEFLAEGCISFDAAACCGRLVVFH